MNTSTTRQLWNYRAPERLGQRNLHVEIIADYGGGHAADHAFSEVRNHFFRFDKHRLINVVTDHPVYAFSTLETGFWIGQEALHSEHKDLVIFSNTAPRGDIKWIGEKRQYFICAMLSNGIPVFAVHAGYNLSFIKERITHMYEVKVPNIGTQFRSRDQYPEATMAIINGDFSFIGKPVPIDTIPDVPKSALASVDGYGNLKTTIRRSYLTDSIKKQPIVRVTLNNRSHFVMNSLAGKEGKAGDLMLVVGSSGGKVNPYIEIVRLMKRAAEDFLIEGPSDNLGPVKIESI